MVPCMMKYLVAPYLTFASVPACCDDVFDQGHLLQRTGDRAGRVVLWSHQARVFVSRVNYIRLLLSLATYDLP